jgi:hypothetical protein
MGGTPMPLRGTACSPSCGTRICPAGSKWHGRPARGFDVGWASRPCGARPLVTAIDEARGGGAPAPPSQSSPYVQRVRPGDTFSRGVRLRQSSTLLVWCSWGEVRQGDLCAMSRTGQVFQRPIPVLEDDEGHISELLLVGVGLACPPSNPRRHPPPQGGAPQAPRGLNPRRQDAEKTGEIPGFRF